MTPLVFIKRMILHVALAAAVGFLIALFVERLVPGFVTPFVNLPGIGLGTIAFALLASTVNVVERSGWQRVVFAVLLAGVGIVGGLIAWSRLNDFGASAVALMLVAGALALLIVYALCFDTDV